LQRWKAGGRAERGEAHGGRLGDAARVLREAQGAGGFGAEGGHRGRAVYGEAAVAWVPVADGAGRGLQVDAAGCVGVPGGAHGRRGRAGHVAVVLW
jgi:hypothetical protein